MEYRTDFPTVPIGGDNPYHMCAHCQLAEPHINGKVKGHDEYCAWRLWVEAGEQGSPPRYQVWVNG